MSNTNNSIIPYGANSPYSNEIGATAEKPSADSQTNNSVNQPSREISELKGVLEESRLYLFLPKSHVNTNTSNFSAETQAGNTSCKFNSQVNAGKADKVEGSFTAGNGDQLSFKAEPDSSVISISKSISPNVTIAGNCARTNSPGDTFSTAGINYNGANTKAFAGYIHTGENCTMAPQTAAPGSTPIQNYKGLEGPLFSLDQQFMVFRNYQAKASVVTGFMGSNLDY